MKPDPAVVQTVVSCKYSNPYTKSMASCGTLDSLVGNKNKSPQTAFFSRPYVQH